MHTRMANQQWAVTKMDKHEDTEDNVWNASGVILDIDSGALIPFCSFLPLC